MSADRLVAGRRPQALTAAECAERLRRELEQYGVAADVHEGFGLALVSVWVDLVVWTDGRWFRGRITKRDDQEVTIMTRIGQMQAPMTFKASEVSEIQAPEKR